MTSRVQRILLCSDSSIELKKKQDKVMTTRFVGKAKGVFQILDERGLINPANKSNYLMNGSINKDTKKRIDEYSLNYLIRKCIIFFTVDLSL